MILSRVAHVKSCSQFCLACKWHRHLKLKDPRAHLQAQALSGEEVNDHHGRPVFSTGRLCVVNGFHYGRQGFWLLSRAVYFHGQVEMHVQNCRAPRNDAMLLKSWW